MTDDAPEADGAHGVSPRGVRTASADGEGSGRRGRVPVGLRAWLLGRRSGDWLLRHRSAVEGVLAGFWVIVVGGALVEALRVRRDLGSSHTAGVIVAALAVSMTIGVMTLVAGSLRWQWRPLIMFVAYRGAARYLWRTMHRRTRIAAAAVGLLAVALLLVGMTAPQPEGGEVRRDGGRLVLEDRGVVREISEPSYWRAVNGSRLSTVQFVDVGLVFFALGVLGLVASALQRRPAMGDAPGTTM